MAEHKPKVFHRFLHTISRFAEWAGSLLGRESGKGEYLRHRRGRMAERAVARYLRKNGYRILERNFTCAVGEIDIVAFRDGTVAFVEVRSFTEPATVDPLHTITPQKQQRIIRAAHRYSTLRRLRQENVVLRFDAVAVRRSKDGNIKDIDYVENAFQT